MQDAKTEIQSEEVFAQTRYGYCFYALSPYPIVYNLYIEPQYRKQGHSRELLQLVIEAIKQSCNEEIISIQAKPRENSIGLEDLKRYYQSLGLNTDI